MSNYSVLKALLDTKFYENSGNEITGTKANEAVKAMVDSLGAGYQFMGVATPNTAPSNPDEKQFYIAMTPGTYTNFGGATIEKYELAIFKGSGATWTKETVYSGAEMRSIEDTVGSSKTLFDQATANAYIGGPFPSGTTFRMTVGSSPYVSMTMYGYRANDTFEPLLSLVSGQTGTVTTTEDFVKIRVNTSSAVQTKVEQLIVGSWTTAVNYLTANFESLRPIFASLINDWFPIDSNALRSYTKTGTAIGPDYPQLNLQFDIRNGEWFNVTGGVSEMYLIWSDSSYTRFYGGWRKMVYPAGKTLLALRFMAPAGTELTITVQIMPDGWKETAEYVVGTQTNVIPPIRALVLGDSYSDTTYQQQWLGPMISKLPPGSSYISLAVSSATLRDRYADRETYPYTSRPVSSDNTGNRNTLGCQIEKLKRLMEGSDLDPDESQIYTDPSEYPNVIIIAAGKNDNPDTDADVATYPAQLNKVVTGVYRKQTTASTADVGDVCIKTPDAEVNRCCFAGAYRHLLDELLSLFPDAQIYFATLSPISYRNGTNVCEVSRKIAGQQRECADIFTATLIDWYRDGQINSVANYAQGSGTADDPYIWGECTLPNRDTNDQLHPNGRGDKKYGHLAASVIRSTFMDIENF